ncbi:MAG TPA: DNA-binding protein WhiA [Lachnospiraceae bacterium]|jgi:cell division protein WhiA|nr:DNA-binding protein WhiA [Lachnospiraceae bacterium]
MSFSGKVKEELSKQSNASRHCQIAETAAIINGCGKIYEDVTGQYRIELTSENLIVARKGFTLLKKTFNIYTNVCVKTYMNQKKGRQYTVSVTNPQDALRVIQAVTSTTIVQKLCCRRAFIRGMFLSSGSISDPEKSYHFEIVCATEEKAAQVQEVINSFSLDAKTVERKKHYVVYIKEGAQIVELLNIMGAHKALMDMENLRIVKEVRNSVNRRVNCETANIGKTVSAAVKQIEDIQLLIDKGQFADLPDNLREIAQIRLEYPEATLLELGKMLTPTVGKSGVNHRLRKLSESADRLRGQEGGATNYD